MKKEGRKKQARSYKQQGKAAQHTQVNYISKEKWAASGGTQTHNSPHSRHAYRERGRGEVRKEGGGLDAIVATLAILCPVSYNSRVAIFMR